MATRGRFKDIQEWPVVEREYCTRTFDPPRYRRRRSKAARLRPPTHKKMFRAVGHLLAWAESVKLLSMQGRILNILTSRNVCCYVEYMFDDGLRVETVRSRLEDLGQYLYHTAPDFDRTFLKKIVKDLPPTDNSAVKLARLKQPQELFELGVKLMNQIRSRSDVTRLAAVEFRDGLMIAFLALRPIRLGELTIMEFGKHLTEDGEGWLVAFQAGETKSGRSLDFSFPEPLLNYLTEYLENYRPLLADKRYAGDALWVGYRNPAKMTDNGVYYAICQRTADEFGHHVNPHLSRDCAATFIALEEPENVEIIRLILAHSDDRVWERHYNQAQSVQASEKHARALDERKRKLRARVSGHLDEAQRDGLAERTPHNPFLELRATRPRGSLRPGGRNFRLS